MTKTKNINADTASNSVTDKINDDANKFSSISIIKNVEFVLDNHSHGKYLRRIVDIVNSGMFVRDGNDLCRLCDLPHETKGGDFQSAGLPGDLKFASENAKICMGGRIDLKTIMEQGKMLVIVYHPKNDKNTPVYSGFVDVWGVKGTTDEAFDLYSKWKEWNDKKRPDFATTKFDSKNFFIDTHEKDDDRFYVKASFIRENIQFFAKNDKYVFKTGIDAKISRFFSTSSDSIANKSENKSVEFKTFTLKEMINNLKDNVFYIPDYQRDLLPNEKFLIEFVADTIMIGESLNRGIFMFHDNGDGKLAVVDGQQRLYNAIKGYFIDNHRLPSYGVIIPFENKPYDVSNLTWNDLLEMAKTEKTVERFVEKVYNSKFYCKLYKGYSYRQMATEYTIANSGAQMNRQELRASFDSKLGDIVRHITTPKLRKSDISKEGVKLFDDIFSTIPSKGTLKDVNIPTLRMNVDSLLSYTFHSCNKWGEGYTENENIIDAEYQNNTDLKKTVKVWKKTESFLEILNSIITNYKDTKESDRYNSTGERGERTHRAKGYVLSKQEEWDLVMFLVLELMRRNNGKKLQVNKDVLSYILKNHYEHVVSGNDIDFESSYGRSVRKEQRTWDEINKIWFPKWENNLLSLNENDLRKIGFDFS